MNFAMWTGMFVNRLCERVTVWVCVNAENDDWFFYWASLINTSTVTLNIFLFAVTHLILQNSKIKHTRLTSGL